MNKRMRRSSAPDLRAMPASHARDRRLGEVIDGGVPTTAEEWALVDTLGLLRAEPADEPPEALVESVLASAQDAAAPTRHRSGPGAFVSWARRRLHRHRGRRQQVGLIVRSASRRAARSSGDRRSP